MPLRLSERTPSGPGAVSVVAISGAGALDVVRRLVARPVVLGTPVLARLRLSDEDVDEILVCASAEDEVELHLHGSVPLVRTVLARLATEHGSSSVSSHAAHGVLERRAVALAPHAASEAGARILLDQAQGALRTELERLVVLESIERDAAIERLLERARVAGFALERTTVVLAGPPNAGKSTLFNVLLGRERAITHGRAGTTRDVLAEEARLGPWPVLLCDTAGIRELRAVDDPHGVEAEGQTRAAQIAESATLVFWLTSPDFDLEPPPRSGARWIRLGTQSDRGGVGEPRVSALQDPEDARRSVEREFRRAFQLPSDPWVAGTPVPFDARLCADLVACRTPASREMVAARLRSWLE